MSTEALPVGEVTRRLSDVIGKKLTAYVGGAHSVQVVDEWIKGSVPDTEVEQRLRFTYEIVCLLSETESHREIQAWLIGINPDLGDLAPLQCIRKLNLDKLRPTILGAVKALIVGG